MPEYYPINLTQMLPSKLFLVTRSFGFKLYFSYSVYPVLIVLP